MTRVLRSAGALASIKLLVAAREHQREDVFTNLICNAGNELTKALLPLALLGQLTGAQLVALAFMNEYFAASGDPARMERSFVDALRPVLGREINDVCREADAIRDLTIQKWPVRQEPT